MEDLKTRVGGDDRIALLESQLKEAKFDQSRYDTAIQALDGLISAQISDFDDDTRKMVEDLPLDAPQKASWLKDNMAVFRKRKAPPVGGKAASIGTGEKQLSASDKKAMDRAARVGSPFKDEADYLESKRLAKERYGG